jgi:hypothetical protein
MREKRDSSLIVASCRRTTSGRLVLVGAMEIIVPLIVAHVIGPVCVSVTVLDLIACVLGTKNVLKVFSTLTLAMLICGE